MQGGLHQSDLIPGHIPGPNPTTLAGCDNPTFTNGVLTLLKNAPYPNSCQKITAPLNCSTGGAGPSRTSPTGKNGTKASPGSTTGGTSATGTPGNGTGTGSNGTGTGSNGTGTAQNADITGSVVNVPGNGSDRILLAVITALGVAAAVAAPPSVAAYLRRRRGGLR